MTEKTSKTLIAETKADWFYKQSVATRGLFVLAIFYTLYLAQSLILPIAISFVLYFFFNPFVEFMKKKLYIPKFFGAALVMIVFLYFLGFSFYHVSLSANVWMQNIPNILDTLAKKLEGVTAIGRHIGTAFNISAIQVHKDWIGIIFTNTWEFFIALGIMLVVLYFLLASDNFFLKRMVLVMVSAETNRDATIVVQQIERLVFKYLFTRTVINIGIAITVALLLYIFQMPDALLLGIMVGVLEFIPFIGAFISLAVITIISIISFDTWWYILMVPISFFVFITIVGNVLVPYLLGKSFLMNIVATVLAVFFMGWIWGILGTFLAVPLLMTLKIMLDSINEPNTVDVLLKE